MNERAGWLAAGVAVLGFAVVALVIGLHPANLPESWIERWLENRLPNGSSIVVVRQAIEDERWQTVDEWVSDNGSLVLVHMGKARLPGRFVYVFFGFDPYGRLTAIDVQKHAKPLSPRSLTSPSAASPGS